MGLHLNYELRLPPSSTSNEVTETLSRLRAFALKLPFKSVSDLYHAAPVNGELRGDGIRQLASIIAKVFRDDTSPPLVGDVDSARGFSVLPGDGCETAAVAFMMRTALLGEPREWFWHASCKTQYASVFGDTHLLACHIGLTTLLDHAIELGVNVVVRDETHYWETRDARRLIEEVHAMNRIVAAFAGKLNDAVDTAAAGRLEAPIFRHPRFERLEMGND